MNLQVSTRSTSPYDAVMPRGVADVGLYNPNALAMLPRTPGGYFRGGKDRERPPSSDVGFWRVVRTVTRSTYLPGDDAQPGPGAYSPQQHSRGGHSEMSARAAAPRRPASSSTSAAAAAWPHLAPKKQVVQYRLRTLGDGSKMFLPAPGLAAAEPQTFIGRETQILKKHRDLVTAARYSRATDQLQQRDRSPEDRWSADKGPLSRAGRPFRFPVGDAVFY